MKISQRRFIGPDKQELNACLKIKNVKKVPGTSIQQSHEQTTHFQMKNFIDALASQETPSVEPNSELQRYEYSPDDKARSAENNVEIQTEFLLGKPIVSTQYCTNQILDLKIGMNSSPERSLDAMRDSLDNKDIDIEAPLPIDIFDSEPKSIKDANNQQHWVQVKPVTFNQKIGLKGKKMKTPRNVKLAELKISKQKAPESFLKNGLITKRNLSSCRKLPEPLELNYRQSKTPIANKIKIQENGFKPRETTSRSHYSIQTRKIKNIKIQNLAPIDANLVDGTQYLRSNLPMSPQQSSAFFLRKSSPPKSIKTYSNHLYDLKKMKNSNQSTFDEIQVHTQDLRKEIGSKESITTFNKPFTPKSIHTAKEIMNRPIFTNETLQQEKIQPKLVDTSSKVSPLYSRGRYREARILNGICAGTARTAFMLNDLPNDSKFEGFKIELRRQTETNKASTHPTSQTSSVGKYHQQKVNLKTVEIPQQQLLKNIIAKDEKQSPYLRNKINIKPLSHLKQEIDAILSPNNTIPRIIESLDLIDTQSMESKKELVQSQQRQHTYKELLPEEKERVIRRIRQSSVHNYPKDVKINSEKKEVSNDFQEYLKQIVKEKFFNQSRPAEIGTASPKTPKYQKKMRKIDIFRQISYKPKMQDSVGSEFTEHKIEILNNDIGPTINRVSLGQRSPLKTNRDFRIEPQNHSVEDQTDKTDSTLGQQSYPDTNRRIFKTSQQKRSSNINFNSKMSFGQ